MTEREQVIERIRKLRALGKSSNEHEAASARRRAKALMQAHGIVESDVVDAAEVGLGEWEVEGADFRQDWRLGLLTATAMRYGCKAIRTFEGARHARGAVVGPKAVADVVIQIYRHFDMLVIEAMSKAVEAELAGAKAALKERENRRTKAYEGWFLEDFIDELDDEIREMDAHDQRVFGDSFCRGATIVLQDRILYGPMEVDIEVLKKPAGEVTAAPGSEAPPAASPGAMMPAPTRTATQNLTRKYMAARPGVEHFSGRSYAENRRAFRLGKKAAEEMKMPGQSDALPKTPAVPKT